jgi:hypothetical protein
MAKRKTKKICKKHYWDLYRVCPFCGLELDVTQSGDNLSFEFSIDIPMPVKTNKHKSGIVTFKPY